MAEPISIQQLKDASLDVKSLEEVVNGDENVVVTTRLGETYPSVKGSIKKVFENGGLPATPFATKALMTASALADGKYAQVTDDTVNNGLYVKTAGAWVKSSYDPIVQANAYTDNTYNKIIKSPILSDYPSIDFYLGNANTWLKSPTYKGKIVNVLGSHSYVVTANNLQDAIVCPIPFPKPEDYGLSTPTFELKTTIPKGGSATIDMQGNDYLWIADKEEGLARLPSNIRIVGVSALLSADVANNLKGASGKVLSADMGKLLNEKILDNEKYLAPLNSAPLEFEPLRLPLVAKRTYVRSADYDLASDQPNIRGVELTLMAGDVLTFDYRSFIGTILWGKASTESNGFVLLAGTHEDNETVKRYSFTAHENMTVRISNSVSESVKVNSVVLKSPSLISLGVYVRLQIATLNTVGSEWDNYQTMGLENAYQLRKGDTIKITNVGKNHVPLLFLSPTGTAYNALGISPNNPITTLIWTADADVKVLMGGTLQSEFFIKRASNIGNFVDAAIKKNVNNPSEVTVVALPPVETVFTTHQNYILKTEVLSGVNNIAISDDLGKTWTYIVNPMSEIVNYHFFSDGTIMLCSSTEVYWTTDYLTLNKSAIYDHDGSVFAPSSWHFFAQQNGDKVQFVGDKEVYVWGEYVIGNFTPRVWYTTDYGKTIKCAAKMGVTPMAGAVRAVRHIHKVVYREKTQTFYMTTGDLETECMLLSAKYDVVADTFTWTLIGQGDNFKFGTFFFDEHYAYILTDYTTEALKLKQGIYRVSENHLGDITKYRVIYKCKPAEWGLAAPFRLIMSNNGNKVLLTDWQGKGYIWVAKDGMNFKKVPLSNSVVMAYVSGANYDGDIYCTANTESVDLTYNQNLRIDGGSYNLTKAIRDSGMSDFMRGDNMFETITGITE